MKKITYFIIAVLTAVLLPQAAVKAAEQEAVILTAEEGRAALKIEIPDSSEGISTLRLRVRIEGAAENLDPEEPLKFETAENVQPELQEIRYNAEKGYFTIYLSDRNKITDKSQFTLGYLVPNTTDDTPGSITISVAEDGLEYVDGTGQLHDKTDIQPSTVVLDINQSAGGPEEDPDNPDNGAGDDADNGSDDGSAGGTENPAAGGSGSESNSGSDSDNGQNVSDGTGVQTGDNTNPVLLCAMAVFSGFAVISALIIRRAGLRRKKYRNRKMNK